MTEEGQPMETEGTHADPVVGAAGADAAEGDGPLASVSLSQRDLRRLERRDRTRAQQLADRLVCLLPVLAGLLAVLEYLYVPSVPFARLTWTYPAFMGGLIALALAGFVASLASERAFEYLRYHAPFYTLVFLLFLAYDVLTVKTGVLPLPYFPWVDQVLNAAIGDAGYLWTCVKSSLRLLFCGYFIGVAVGLATGVACGYSRRVSYWVDPFLKVLGAIPSTTWIPVVMVIAASLFSGAVFIIALGVWFAVTIATATGIKNIDPALYEAARTLGASTRELVVNVAIPSALPSIFQGMIQAMSSACTALLVAEMVGVESGLGWYITWQKSWAQYGKMYAAIVIICLVFVLVNFLLKRISGRVLRWRKGLDG